MQLYADKAEFVAQPGIRGLSAKEKSRRWKRVRARQASQEVSNTRTKWRTKGPAQRGIAHISGKLDHCAAEYGSNLIAPWSAIPACVPTVPALSSRKVKVFAKGELYIGTAGVGFIMTSADMTNGHASGYPIATSNKLYAGTVLTRNTAGGATVVGVDETGFNSPYSVTDFEGDGHSPGTVQGRLVGLGVRIKYAGTELKMGDLIYPLEEPDHNDLQGKSLADLRAYDRCTAYVCNSRRDWIGVTYQPIDPEDFRFAASITGQHSHAQFLGILVSGEEGNRWTYEVFETFEVIGSTVRGKTPSHAAVDQMSNVISVVSQAPNKTINRVGNAPNSSHASAMKWVNMAASLAKKAQQAYTNPVGTLASALLG